jgi:cytochrome c553
MWSSGLIPENLRRHSAAWTFLLIVLGVGLIGCQLGATNASTRGKELFNTCAACHGPAGQGNRELGAPGIAGMNARSIELQLQKFRSGLRGTQFNDYEGMRMRPMALSLRTDEDVKAVATYAASLPAARHAPVVGGDPQAGRALYATCMACHGLDGAGNETLGAPRIAGVEDWYLAAELRKYNGGVRGGNPKDAQGMLMGSMSKSLADEAAIRNVVAYIETLKP